MVCHLFSIWIFSKLAARFSTKIRQKYWYLSVFWWRQPCQYSVFTMYVFLQHCTYNIIIMKSKFRCFQILFIRESVFSLECKRLACCSYVCYFCFLVQKNSWNSKRKPLKALCFCGMLIWGKYDLSVFAEHQ